MSIPSTTSILATLVVAPVSSFGSDPCCRIAEVEAAGSVEGFLGGADRVAGGEVGVLVVIVAGAVDGESPLVGRPR